MKHPALNQRSGFTLVETMVSVAAATVLLAATFTGSIALQKSFRAADDYFATHMQQIRIVDYLDRDVKRALSASVSVDAQSVTVTLPNYIIQAGDSEALVDPSLIGTPRTPTVTRTSSGPQVNYAATTSTVTYSVTGLSIVRIENGAVTTIASSTDRLLPQSTDVELANTEYTTTTVTFLPIFTSGNATVSRSGTTVCATSYLRNRRRA